MVATQNPIEQEGTYPLPEAQLDRFMMQIMMEYPTPAQEEEILMKTTGAPLALPEATFDRASFLTLRELVWAVPVPPSVAAYAVRLCGGSRPTDSRAGAYIKDYVAWGAGPRGSQNLVRAAKAKALLGESDGADGGGHPGGGAAGAAAPDHREPPGGGRCGDER